MPNLLPVSRVVQVAVQMAPLASQLRNFGAALIVGSSDVIDHVERIRTYSASELDTIATDFGVDAPEYQAAVAFFDRPMGRKRRRRPFARSHPHAGRTGD